MDFLETDFKKRRIPKRNTMQKTQNGLKVGLDLEKYPSLKKELMGLLNSGFNKESINIRKGDFSNNIPDSLFKLIEKKIKALPQKSLEAVFKKIQLLIEEKAVLFEKEYDKFLEESKEETKSLFAKNFILPFLDDLDKPLANLNLADENSKFQLEVDVTDSLFSVIETKYEELLRAYFHKPNKSDLLKSLNETITLPEIKGKLIQFFESFSISDAFLDLYQIYRNNQLIDKTEIYLYFYELSLGNEKFPVIYLPITIERENNKFVIQFEKRIFINSNAINFVVQEFNIQLQKKDTLAGEFDRIIYLNGDNDFLLSLETIIRKLENFFELSRNINLQNPELQMGVNLLSSLSNKAYIFIFDKSDESLINDYEEILTNSDDLIDTFSSLLNGFIEENPKSFVEEISDEWHDQDIPSKLTVESPIPLNEEQKQVLMALQKPDCKFLILEGPPGTGKSHTITAVICKALLEEKSVLVLSDKKEALDVVEEKISETLNRVRHEDDFQNPILRLGKGGNKFNKILNGQTISKIREHYHVYKHKKDEFLAIKNRVLDNARANLEENIAFFENIKLGDIAFYFENIGIKADLTNEEKDALEVINNNFASGDFQVEDLEKIRQIYHVAKEARRFFHDDFNCQIIDKFTFTEKATPLESVETLKSYILKIETLKKPVIGYLFQNKNIFNSTCEFKKTFPFFDLEYPERDLKLLSQVHGVFSYILSNTEDSEDFRNIISGLSDDKFENLKNLSRSAKLFLKNENLVKYSQFESIRKKLEVGFKNQPKDIYFQSIGEIESLVTAEMTHFLDHRIIQYVDNHKNELETLKNIIRKKQKFPQELFKNLKKAFPCILAGIRDYAEFIPLEKDLFDLIIIDEASQVSIAQALPALIRGKQVVILGDDKQFSNVKSNNASTVINQQYKSRVQNSFISERMSDGDKFGLLNKIKENFDIKNSILKFVKFIGNYECLLRKHFRCYPEIISYSDKYFYEGHLQCMKIRGKKIEDVIKFEIIKHDGKLDETKNTNEMEVDFIISKLREFKENNIEQSLGIITPHREQVSLLWDRINNIPEKDWLFDKCKLKIMTFDTCQGEERDYIFYSMVATKEKDRLNWIFLVDFASRDDEVDGTIKSQRLNVGFSRAKECIHFVLSKPIEEFKGEIKNAMLHYQNELSEGKRKIIGGTDKNSGMEHKIQHYFFETTFYKDNKEKIEFIPQFELGKYLRQLDKTYQHPDYKVDFLLIFDNQKIIIEYDGFKEHFTDCEEVNEMNYEFYMRDEDIYRQKVLEGYGYKFLRINRFNIGDDPVESFDERLRDIVKKKLKIRKH
jgi:superfamily I DNA and/or RNA helicase/very-short-patch-repair endonuclease